jgi:membrane protein DedA with SNARE-associated domain
MLSLVLIAALISLLSLVGLVLSVTSGLITAGVDGLFIVLVCLLTGTVFGLLALFLAARAGYLPVPERFKSFSK